MRRPESIFSLCIPLELQSIVARGSVCWEGQHIDPVIRCGFVARQPREGCLLCRCIYLRSQPRTSLQAQVSAFHRKDCIFSRWNNPALFLNYANYHSITIHPISHKAGAANLGDNTVSWTIMQWVAQQKSMSVRDIGSVLCERPANGCWRRKHK